MGMGMPVGGLWKAISTGFELCGVDEEGSWGMEMNFERAT